MSRFFDSEVGRARAVFTVFLATLAVLLLLPQCSTVEGWFFSGLSRFAFLLVLSGALAFSLRALTLWLALRGALKRLAVHPIISVLGNLPEPIATMFASLPFSNMDGETLRSLQRSKLRMLANHLRAKPETLPPFSAWADQILAAETEWSTPPTEGANDEGIPKAALPIKRRPWAPVVTAFRNAIAWRTQAADERRGNEETMAKCCKVLLGPLSEAWKSRTTFTLPRDTADGSDGCRTLVEDFIGVRLVQLLVRMLRRPAENLTCADVQVTMGPHHERWEGTRGVGAMTTRRERQKFGQLLARFAPEVRALALTARAPAAGAGRRRPREPGIRGRATKSEPAMTGRRKDRS